MKETSKSHILRLAGDHYHKFLHGIGLDIGAGDDPLKLPEGTGDVIPWDLEHGDAQLLEGIMDEQVDFVYSSHCLEHMRDMEEALRNWARVVKPGGYLYITVPDYTLYEHHRWPSRYNQDHKQSFSLHLTRKKVGRDNHWSADDLDALGCEIGLNMLEGETRLQDEGYNYNLGEVDQTMTGAVAQILFIFEKTK